MNYETENVEFKSGFTEEIYKEVIAFANTDGGTIYVGIDDNGNAVGLTDVDDEYTRITNGIRDAIQPDVTMFVKYTIQDNKVVKITVSEGANKPYYLRGKGLKPSGVYVRQGASSVQSSAEQIRRMIRDTDGDVFEEMRTLDQSLSFDAAGTFFGKYGIEFSEIKYRTLGITDSSGLYTNLALILSDQCPHTIKIAVFSDTAKTVFKDSREFGGSVFTQLEDTVAYLKLCNKTSAVINGLERVEKSDYPEEALREALLNAIVHRDYSYSGSIIINVDDTGIEFISIGGLMPGLSAEDIRSGISQPRNKKLADVFHRLHLIESYGTGIRRIFSLYSGLKSQPVISVTPNTFKIVLPNMNTEADTANDDENYVTPQMQKILDYIYEHGHITDEEIGVLLELKKTRIFNLTTQMREMGLIYSKGRGKTKLYFIKK